MLLKFSLMFLMMCVIYTGDVAEQKWKMQDLALRGYMK